METDRETPTLKAELPDELFWLEDEIRRLVKPAAFLRRPRPAKGESLPIAQMGSTRSWGRPDVPMYAKWAPHDQLEYLQERYWNQSPYDGDSFWLQLNLEEIPEAVRPSHCPKVGVVWVFINCTGLYHGEAHFDPRPAGEIQWHPRKPMPVKDQPPAAEWRIADTLPDVTEKTFPAIASNWDSMSEVLSEWMQRHYPALTDFQVGGWDLPCQGEFDSHNETLVCSMSRQEFGDSGEVSLHYSSDRGFFVYVQTS